MKVLRVNPHICGRRVKVMLGSSDSWKGVDRSIRDIISDEWKCKCK